MYSFKNVDKATCCLKENWNVHLRNNKDEISNSQRTWLLLSKLQVFRGRAVIHYPGIRELQLKEQHWIVFRGILSDASFVTL